MERVASNPLQSTSYTRAPCSSVSQVVATRYEVLVEHKFAEQGRALLANIQPFTA